MTLDEVRAQWDAGPGAELGLELDFAATNERQGYVALDDSDADLTAQRLAIVADELRKYPPQLLGKSRLSTLRMVKGGKFSARAGGYLIVFNEVSPSRMPYIVHHEMMHVLDTTDPSWRDNPRWVNPPGFVYAKPVDPDITGFVSTYAKTAYREDLADTAAYIWVNTDHVLERCSTDELLRNKCRMVVAWWSSQGLTRFDELFNVRTVMTERIAGNTRFDTAVEVSKLRFPDAAPVVYLASSHNFPDALVAGTLAADGPLLLVPPEGAVPQVVLDEVARLQPSRVVAVGGASAVPDQAVDAVRRAATEGTVAT